MSDGRIEITLSERGPIRVDPEAWPIIAQARGFRGGSNHERQANELFWIKVRQHADGRTLVYCSRHRGPGGMPIEYRSSAGGWLLDAPVSTESLVTHVRRCAGIVGDHDLGNECIADLPPEDL